jgi:Flp pilus assembly protein TadD
MPASDRPRRAYGAVCVLALLALVATYSNHFGNAFHFDDSHAIQNNLYIRSLRNIPRFFVDTRTVSALPANQSYRPLVTTTLAIDYRLGHGLGPVAFHVTSFVFFALQCAAMLWLFEGLLDRARPHPSNRWVALVAAAWYAFHTANAETVNYLIQRAEILSTLGVVLTLVVFAHGGRGRRWGLYLVPAAAAVLGKEQGAMVAPLLFLYVALFERQLSAGELLRPRAFGAVLRDTWPAFLVCGAILIVGFRLETTFHPGGPSWPYLLAQPFVLVHYLLAFFLPVNLSADTDWQRISNPFDDRVLVGVAVLAVVLGMAVRASRRRETRPIAYGLLWFFIALIPTSSVVPLAEVMNDHRMFFPFVGLTLAVSWAIALTINTRPPSLAGRLVVTGAAVMLLSAHAWGTWQRNKIWHTEESLWLDVTEKSPENGRGLMNYGLVQMGKGNFAVAEDYFNRALQRTPRYAYLHVNMGVLKGAQGQPAEAERHFLEAQQDDPGDPVSYRYYARWLHSVGRIDEAAANARRATELSPADLEAQQLLAVITASQRTHASPETPEQWLTLSLAQYRAGQYEDCLESSRRALELRPAYSEAFNNMCAANNALGRYADGVAACERALAINPEFQLARNNLAVARAQLAKSR